jgi:hypothetical protein
MKTTIVVALAATLLAVTLMVYSGVQVPSSSWRQAGYLKASSPHEGDQFGHAIAISGDGNTLAIGAPMENSGATGIDGNPADSSADDAGAVYVYTRGGSGGWTHQAYLKASNAEAFDQFGNALALSADGNTLAVAAYFESGGATGIGGSQADNSRPQSGAVYVFVRTGGQWSQQSYIKASNTGEQDDGDTFGYSIALSDDGNTLAVGAPSEDGAATGINGNERDNSSPASGAAYVFERRDAAWSQRAYVKSAATHDAMLFGYSVGLNADGGTLAVGAFDERGCSNAINGPYEMKCGGTGAVYVFARAGEGWSQAAYLKAREQDRGDSLGVWLATSDDGMLVAAGAADEDSTTTGIDAVQSGHSGTVGAEDDRSSGAAYLFARSGSAWSQLASFKASNTGTTDWFGVRLALSGDGSTLAIAAPNEDSSARGLDGEQNDNSAEQAGAVYVFSREGGRWGQQAYLKGSNTEAFDEFGSAVAVSSDGRTLAVAARLEDSSARGLNGDEADNSMTDAGAVYVFTR